jgi:hypothetical protein
MSSWGSDRFSRWISQSALQALEDAYQTALAIQAIERQHFNGNAIMAQPGVSKTVADYFRTQLDRQLLRIRSNLLRFRLSGFLVDRQALAPNDSDQPPAPAEMEAAILQKLEFIESVVQKYRVFNTLLGNLTAPEADAQSVAAEVVPDARPDSNSLLDSPTPSPSPDQLPNPLNRPRPAKAVAKVTAKAKSVKSKQPEMIRLFGGAGQISKEFDPKYEQEVVQELRARRSQNRMAVRWLIMLLFVPLLVQTVTKNIILGPILGDYFDRNPSKVELSREVAEEFLAEFRIYREGLELKRLLTKAMLKEQEQEEISWKNTPEEDKELVSAIFGEAPAELLQDMLSNQPGKFRSMVITSGWTEVEAELEERALEEKAVELWREARQRQLGGIKNVIADGAALLSFVVLLVVGRPKLQTLQTFSNRAFLSLNDPTKVFLFILVTDMFVGFHSAEGWEVILEGLAHHFGIPESKVLIYGFIATVPVILDSCVKFWIFNYLTRYSPSTSAIYERMNT